MMSFEINSCYEATTLEQVWAALGHIREHQLEPQVQYVPHKVTDTHCVHELQYETALLLAPLIGAHVVLREDMVFTDDAQIIVKTVSQNYDTKAFPYMMTETVFRPGAADRATIESTLQVEWGLSEYIPDLLVTRLTSFGQSLYADATARLEASLGTVKASTRSAK